MRASILCVGTELTDGQIVNRNAAWLSARLKTLGFRVDHHLCVPDTHGLILEGLQYLALKSELIFVTGGLGPTSDDFTRDVIAEWAGKELAFDAGSWEHVSQRLTSRGLVVHDFQKQQCFFPSGAVVLPNPQGTANGFRLAVGAVNLVVLPGPPREIQAVWESGLLAWLSDLGADLDPIVTKSWDTLGRGESMIAAEVEPVVAGRGLEIGYRVHHPYVEVKASLRRSALSSFAPAMAEIERVLAPVTIVRDGADLAALLCEFLQKQESFEVVDLVSEGFLWGRLQPHMPRASNWTFSTREMPASTSAVRLGLVRKGEFHAEVNLQTANRSETVIFELPEGLRKIEERGRQYFAEMALLFWWQNLSR